MQQACSWLAAQAATPQSPFRVVASTSCVKAQLHRKSPSNRPTTILQEHPVAHTLPTGCSCMLSGDSQPKSIGRNDVPCLRMLRECLRMLRECFLLLHDNKKGTVSRLSHSLNTQLSIKQLFNTILCYISSLSLLVCAKLLRKICKHNYLP